MKFSEIKGKIQNLGNFKSLKEIKKAGLRVVRNTRTGDYWLIEENYLKPVIKSPRESRTIKINLEKLKYKIIICEKTKKELSNSKILDYIRWGEKQSYNMRPTTSSKRRWWLINDRKKCDFVIPAGFSDYFIIFENQSVLVDKRMYEGYCNSDSIITVLNSYLFPLMMELGSSAILGEGLLDITVEEVENIRILDPRYLGIKTQMPEREIKNVFEEANIDPDEQIKKQEPKPLSGREKIDNPVFDSLGLKEEEERREVYWAVCELVKNRLEKAKSV